MAKTTNLVAQVIDELDPAAVVLKYVLVVEVINAEGDRNVWTTSHPDAKRWDTYGLLTEALMQDKAQQIASVEAGE